jgi:hypothetical protein
LAEPSGFVQHEHQLQQEQPEKRATSASGIRNLDMVQLLEWSSL